MKNFRKIAAILLILIFMAGCAQVSGSKDSTDTQPEPSAETDAPTEGTQALTLPILDEIDGIVTVGVAGSSLAAVQAAVKLLDWGLNTGLDTAEIRDAAAAWLAEKNNEQSDSLQKLELVDSAYQQLLTDEARDLMDCAGCADTEITWGSEPVEAVEAIMQAAGLR